MTPAQFIKNICQELDIQRSRIIHSKIDRTIAIHYWIEDFADTIVGPASVAAAITWASIGLFPRELPGTERENGALVITVRY